MEVTEIRELIYAYWALENLKTNCAKYQIDYHQLDKFLRENDGIIFGESLLSCFRPDIASGEELNIFIINKKKESPDVIINRLKTIFLAAPEPPHCVRYFTTFFDAKGIIPRQSKLHITIYIGKSECFSSVEQVVRSTSMISCSAIGYDGNSWIIPFINISQLMEKKMGTILNPSLIYDWQFNEVYEFETILPNLIHNSNQEFINTVIPQDVRNCYINYTKLFDNFKQETWAIREKFAINYIPPSGELSSFHRQVVMRIRKDGKARLAEYIGWDQSDEKISPLFYHIVLFLSRGYILTNLSDLSNLVRDT